MNKCYLIIYLVALLIPGIAIAQTPGTSCGQKEVTDRLFINNPHLKVFQQQIEKQMQAHTLRVKKTIEQPYQPNAVVTLPVVVHIIHNNGTENLSDAQVFTAIQHLNEAFANTGYYDPNDGVNTEIQFCLAQRDPNNNPTNGIDRVVSPLTVMDGWNNGAQDIAVKNLSRWDPRCYINIWIVREITGPVAGYAYLPSAHGMNIDGIVGEAAYFGSSNANDVLIIHEMGHYLGLYHTFQGGCTNNDCSKDGDQVCDTPPDQSTAGISCNSTANSCSTDALSGFSTDVNDLHTDYLDYGNWNCMKVFTQGQATRMNWMIQNVRKSLLNCKSCLSPCPTPVVSNFSSSANNVPIGTTVNFTNSSANASGYKWYINNTLQTTTTNFSYTFNTVGTYIIKLWALTNNALCDSAVRFDTVRVSCPVNASFTPGSQTVPINTNINFIGTSTGALTYQWLLNGVSQSAAINYPHLFTSAGYHEIKLRASNGLCYDSATVIITVIDTTSQTPVDSCKDYIFQRTLGSSGDDYAFDFRYDYNSYFIAGKTIGQRGDEDGLLMRLNAKGEIVWTKTWGGADNEQLNYLTKTTDGNFVFAGIIKAVGNVNGKMIFIKTDPSGNELFKRIYSVPFPLDEISGITATSDGGFAVCGLASSSVVQELFIAKAAADGQLNWATTNTISVTKPGGIIQINDTLVVSVYYDADAFTHISYLARVNINTGNAIDANSYSTLNAPLEFGEINWNNNSIEITGKTGFPHFIPSHQFKLELASNGQLKQAWRLYNVDSTVEKNYLMSQDGKIFAQGATQNPGSLTLIKPNSAVSWNSKVVTTGLPAFVRVKNLDNEGVAAIGNTASTGISGQDIYLLKISSAGSAGKCDNTEIPTTLSSLGITITPAFISRATVNAVQEYTQIPVQNKFIENWLICLDSTKCTIPPTDTCGNITFQKKIGGTGIDHAFDIKALANNEYLIAGSTTSTPGTGNNEEALILKLNNRGNILWQRSIGGARKDQYTKIVINTAGEYLVFGKTESQHNSNGSMLLTKFDVNGVILWTKEYNFTNASLTGFENVTGAVELSNGDIAFCANAPGINTDVGQPLPATFNIIGVLSNNGSLKWAKRFREYYTESGGAVTGIIAMNDALFISASYGIMKMTASDGTLLGLQKKFQNLGSFNSIEQYGSQVMIYSNSHQMVFDQNLNLISAYMMLPQEAGYLLSANGFSSDNGSAIQGDYNRSNIDYSVFLSRFNGSGNIKWNYKYPYPLSEYRGLSGSRNTSDNGLVSIGTRYRKISDVTNEPADIYILRTDSLGRIPDCPRASLNTTLQSVQGNFIELHARVYPMGTQVFDLSLQAMNPQLSAQSLCSTQECTTLALSARDTICSFSDTIQIRAVKDSGCNAFTEWIVDTTTARILSQNDSMLVLQFKAKGVFTIYARLTGGCLLIQDSVRVTVFNSPDSINLGPDIQLCKISTYTFNAGAGFKSYLWQDGSTDSTLTIYYPGIYHVIAEDYCGNQYRDTVVVSQSPDIPFDLGPDLTKCNNDTLSITAPTGFSKYYWSPGYRIDSLYARTIKVSPLQDTTYIVIAERSPGCLVTDSIRVHVNRSIPVQIGNDTSFCQNDSISISANSGFNTYQWNTGATGRNIWVNSSGNYSVIATDSNGCKSSDTMTIVSLIALPAINLGADIPVCRNSAHSFDPGNFSGYLWQDSSTSRMFNATVPGQYWVRVTNANGCVNSDTVSIVGYTESPKNFLDSSAEICLGQTLEIRAASGYKQYRWFNNSSSPSINITAPGVYWLEITNAEGCVTRDSIFVKGKDCVKGIFFPNAFTPGNGGKNNVFRPIVSGQIESFHMIVFNRYGQKVFESTDAYKGWDGRINSQLQGTNTFTWTATYRFSGANEKQQISRGTVTLIR